MIFNNVKRFKTTGNPSLRRTTTVPRHNAQHNIESWAKLNRYLTDHDEIATLEELASAIGYHTHLYNARSFVAYCIDYKWLRIVVPA